MSNRRVDLYRERLKAHDWTFAYSDDHDVYSRGLDEWLEIQKMQQEIDPDRVILNQYKPEGV